MEIRDARGTTGRIIIDAIARFADRLAISDGVVRWTYREFGEAISKIISAYHEIGLRPGDGVAILTGNRAESWAAICAANIMGLRFSPLHPLAAEDDQVFIATDADVAALIVDPARFEQRGRNIRKRIPGVAHFLSVGPMESAHDLIAHSEKFAPAPLIDQASSDSIMWLAYTGGTTGRSKGVMLPHRALAMMTVLCAADYGWPSEVRHLVVTPISHAGGAALYPVMFNGGYIRLMPGFDAEKFCRIVAEERITSTFAVPTILSVLLAEEEIRSRFDLSSLELIIYGAAPMSPEKLRQAIAVFGPVLMQLYGQSECPQAVAHLRKSDHLVSNGAKLGSCGRVSALIDVKLFDPDMTEVAVGEVGEICVQGPMVMDGYWRQPELTADAFRGGWLHTGDLAYRDADGYLFIVDRAKDMIISGGFNIYPREVEDALQSHSAVALAAVIGVPDDKWGEAVKAFVVIRGPHGITEAVLQQHVKECRGAPWSPKSIEFLAEIPLTSLGKIDRKKLREPYWEGRTRAVS